MRGGQSQKKMETLRARQKTERGRRRGLTARDGCDFSQIPKGPEEKTALCSDNTVLSGVLCVCLFCSSGHWHWCLSTNTSLHYAFRWETQAWRREEQQEKEQGEEVNPRLSGWKMRAGSYTILAGNQCVTIAAVCICQYWFCEWWTQAENTASWSPSSTSPKRRDKGQKLRSYTQRF